MFKDKQTVLDKVTAFCKEHGIPVDQVTVGGGGAMVLMGIRETTKDLNLWVDSPYFERLAEANDVLVHPMRDSCVQRPEQHQYIRRRNRYFEHVVINGVQCFAPLALLIFARGSYATPERPLAKRQQDHKDIVILNDILATKNKVFS